MDDMLTPLLLLVYRTCAEKLSLDGRYRRSQRESKEAWAQFQRRYSSEVCTAAIDLMDHQALQESLLREQVFFLGLKMGVLVGNMEFPAG